MNERFSNGDKNPVSIHIHNQLVTKIKLSIIDEIPIQFQERAFKINTELEPHIPKKIVYNLRPVSRGEYEFGNILLFLHSILGLIRRRVTTGTHQTIKVYPSYIHQKKYIIQSGVTQHDQGSARTRVVASSNEFDQIKEYTIGDDIRRINWKATARKGDLMINSYIDERSQQIYSIIDMGRIMKMPFNEMSLLDYSINAALMLSYIALYKNDKAGIITFSHKLHDTIRAKRNRLQVNIINETLYNQDTQFKDSNYEQLLNGVEKEVGNRSLLVLFTNFETKSGLMRQLPYLKRLSKKHLVCVVLFKNTGLTELIHKQADSLESIYKKTIAEDFAFEKKLISKELHKNGILSIYTEPQQLTVDVINKYVQLKKTRQL